MQAEIDILRDRGHHPRRAPDWRWRLARAINNTPYRRFRGNESDDEHVLAASAIQSAYKDHQSADELAEMLAGWGPVREAYEFWTESHAQADADRQSAGTSKPDFQPVSMGVLQLATLEAYLLTGSPSSEISRYIPLTPAGVDAYEKLFFDVRSRLAMPGWISTAAIGPLYQTGPLTMIPNLTKAYGYYSRSLDVARTVSTTFNEALMQQNAGDADRLLNADRRATSAARAALAIRMMNLNYNTYEKIIELHNDTLETDAKLKLDAGTAAEESLLTAVEILRQQLDWSYGEAPTNLADQRLLAGPGLKLVRSNDVVG